MARLTIGVPLGASITAEQLVAGAERCFRVHDAMAAGAGTFHGGGLFQGGGHERVLLISDQSGPAAGQLQSAACVIASGASAAPTGQ